MHDYRRWKDRIILSLKGVGMGSADIIPGVSGGTIALITGIYQELIAALSAIGLHHILPAIKLAVFFWDRKRRTEALEQLSDLNWNFLLPLLAGIATAILIMSKIIPWMMSNYPYHTYSLFFGLILFSIPIPFRETDHHWLAYTTMAVFGIGTFLLVGETSLATGSENLLYVFMCGAVAICAMILPGISGAYILVLFGEYKFILESLRALDIMVVGSFLLGILVGILSFVRLLKYLLQHQKSTTMAALTGIMAGSLRKVWPVDHLPQPLSQTPNSEVWIGIAVVVLGAAIVIIMDKVTKDEEPAS